MGIQPRIQRNPVPLHSSKSAAWAASAIAPAPSWPSNGCLPRATVSSQSITRAPRPALTAPPTMPILGRYPRFPTPPFSTSPSLSPIQNPQRFPPKFLNQVNAAPSTAGAVVLLWRAAVSCPKRKWRWPSSSAVAPPNLLARAPPRTLVRMPMVEKAFPRLRPCRDLKCRRVRKVCQPARRCRVGRQMARCH